MTPPLRSDSASTFSARVTRAHIPVLDGMRGIAVLCVMILHFALLSPATGAEQLFFDVTRAGWIGVDLFFVLSGFLITGILYDAKGGAHFFRNFYMRRVLRIFPLYYAFLVLVLILLPMVRPAAATPAGTQLWLWTYLSNVLFARVGWEGVPGHTTHLWSLAIEEQFYLLWPLVVFLASRRRLLQICVGAIVFAELTRIGLHYTAPNGIAGYALMPARIDALAVGALVAVLAREASGAAVLLRFSRPVMIGAALWLGVVIAWTQLAVGAILPPLDVRIQLGAYTAIALLFGALLVRAIAAPDSSRRARLLNSATLAAFGRYSYALYLVHILVRNVFHGQLAQVEGKLPTLLGSQLPAQVGVLLAGIGISYALAFTSWHLFEKHFLALKRFFNYERRAAAAPLAPGAPVSIAAGADLGGLSSGLAPRLPAVGLVEEGRPLR
jgi:peptidoglycan/LPS O-acetylase OafA/YrhL